MKNLEELIRHRRARVGVIGLGYVGLPLALEFAKAGFPVTGFEVDAAKAADVNAGRSYIADIPSKELRGVVSAGKLSATTDFRKLSAMNAIIICVPTPLRKTREPDFSYIESAVAKVSAAFRKGQLVVLESTTYPGTTRDMVLPPLEGKGCRVGRDFYLAFSPERVDPGNPKFGIRNTPKIVGGITPGCLALASALYGAVVDRVVPVSSTEAAEMAKLLENTFRAVNIGLVNEVALMCDRLKLDVWEVIDAASTKPFGYMAFQPGPGIGGHCIPLDPHYLAWKLKSLNFTSRFIDLAGEINAHMPDFLVSKIADALNARGKSVKGARILLVGLAYKKDVSDTRESPSLDVMELLHGKDAVLSYHDPYIPAWPLGGRRMKSVPLSAASLKNFDAVVILTNHSNLDVPAIVRHAPLVIDSRNATKGLRGRNIVKL